MFRKSSKCINQDRGLSLLEVLISMIVLAVGILGLAPMIVLSIEGNDISRDFSLASELAKKQLEELQAKETIMEPDLSQDSTWEGLPDIVYDDLDDTLGFARFVSITKGELRNPPRICTVQVSLSWTDKMGKARATTHTTLMTNSW